VADQNTSPDDNEAAPDWWLYHGDGRVLDVEDRDRRWPAPPAWRDFRGGPVLPDVPVNLDEIRRRLGVPHGAQAVPRSETSTINAAIHLRRPLLVTGAPGTGKSSLAYKISYELGLGPVLVWPVTSRDTLKAGLYAYDAIGRVQAQAEFRAPLTDGAGHLPPPIGDYIHLGPLGTALLPQRLPRVLLIDEFDKSDIDLPNDLLNVFEDGEFTIPELTRLAKTTPDVEVQTDDADRMAVVHRGRIRCREFPIVVITSNGEREFSPAFLRRCLRLDLPDPSSDQLAAMVAAHFSPETATVGYGLIEEFLQRRGSGPLAADQLLNAVHLATSGAYDPRENRAEWTELINAVWRNLSTTGL
jgi:MoxR-like ATPase